MVGLPGLSFALGIYLSLSTMAAVFAGGVVRRIAEARAGAGSAVERGILCASGFVAGEGLAGVMIAAYAFWKGTGREPAVTATGVESLPGLVVLLGCAYVLYRAARAAAPTSSVNSRGT